MGRVNQNKVNFKSIIASWNNGPISSNNFESECRFIYPGSLIFKYWKQDEK